MFMYIYIYMHIHTCVCMCVHIYIHIYRERVMCVYIYMYIYTCVYIYIYTSLSLYIYIYIYIWVQVKPLVTALSGMRAVQCSKPCKSSIHWRRQQSMEYSSTGYWLRCSTKVLGVNTRQRFSTTENAGNLFSS